jgi:putative oxidoreductase
MSIPSWFQDAGLWVLRVGLGASMALAHGVPKLLAFAEKAPKFADPLHLGPVVSFALAAGAETFGALFVALGLFTRPAAAIDVDHAPCTLVRRS